MLARQHLTTANQRIKLADVFYRCYDDKEIYEEKHLTS